MHYEYLSNYIIKSPDENNEEIKKILEYMQGNKLTNINKNTISNASYLIRDEIIDRPLRRPTTPMTVISSTSNSQIFNIGK
jgi:hypothetical protein